LGAGVDAQLSRLFVVGAFANFDWSSIDTRGTLHIDSTTVDVSAFELKNAWTVGGRAGVLITSSTLVYGLLGYSWLDFRQSAHHSVRLERRLAGVGLGRRVRTGVERADPEGNHAWRRH
jgi:hypothetical protein